MGKLVVANHVSTYRKFSIGQQICVKKSYYYAYEECHIYTTDVITIIAFPPCITVNKFSHFIYGKTQTGTPVRLMPDEVTPITNRL